MFTLSEEPCGGNSDFDFSWRLFRLEKNVGLLSTIFQTRIIKNPHQHTHSPCNYHKVLNEKLISGIKKFFFFLFYFHSLKSQNYTTT